MALTSWSAFLPEVLPDVQGCPVPLVENALRRASIHLLRPSRLVTTELAAMDVTATVGKYTLVAPAGLQIIGVEEAAFQGNPLDPLAVDVAKANFHEWQTATGTPEFYVQLDPYTLALVRVPDTTIAGALTVKVAVAPGNAATGVEAAIAEAYFDEIAAGAKAYLMAQPRKVWSDPQLAQFHQGTFDKAVARAIGSKAEGTGRARRRTTTYYR